MTVEINPTKIELIDNDRACVTVIIQSDLGLLTLDLMTPSLEGDANAILQQAREVLQKFGNELLNAAGRRSLKLGMPIKK